MTQYLIDTNVISEFVKPQPDANVILWLERADLVTLFASVITFGEMRLGIEDMPTGRRRSALDDWLNTGLPQWFAANLLPVDQQIADRWGRLTILAKRSGMTLGMADGLLASTAFEHELTLVTRNRKDFAHLGVPLLNPWDNEP